MAEHWRYFLFLLWISYLIISGIVLFTRGFLLSRDTFTDNSTCVPSNLLPCSLSNSAVNITNGHEYHCSQEDKLASVLNDFNSASKLCFPQRAKVILLVIDALRYDFVTYNPSLVNPHPFQNKMPVIKELLEKHGDKSKLYKFIADPPTTTMQRLKALTTGSLPTFIDAGSNFATAEINEDNIIDQLKSHHHNVVFMGDDTWGGLYPKRFTRKWDLPSFNVHDLDTVDHGIISNLYSEIKKSDWSVIIAHFLGVDHCGHRYGPFHPEMERKLTEMNGVIKNVVSTMDENTMLFVIGDHGMTHTGDHGGTSELEVTSALFVYSPLPFNGFTNTKSDSVKQIDLVPTLASILGVPIPFSNLGCTILDILPSLNSTKTPISDWQLNLLSLWSNVQQTTNYIRKYSEELDSFNEDKLSFLNQRYSILKSRLHRVNKDNIKTFASDATDYLQMVYNMCEEVWAQFDSFAMSRGLLLIFLTVFFLYIIVDGIPKEKLPVIFMSSFLMCSYTAMAITGFLCVIGYYLSLVENLEQTFLFSTGMISIIMMAILIIQHWEAIAICSFERSKKRTWADFIGRIILLAFTCILFSNSYIIEEAGVLSFMLLTMTFICIYVVELDQVHHSKKEKNNSYLRWNPVKLKLLGIGLLVGILVRISINYWKCREEQQWCIQFLVDSESQNDKSGRMECVSALIFMAFLVTVTRIWLRSCGNLVGFSPTVTMARYAPSVIVVCTGGFWLLHRLPKESKLIAPWQTDMLTWIVYALILISIVSTVIQPLCVYVLPKRKDTVSVYGQENIVPQLFNQMKELFQDKKHDGTKNMPIVCGLGTVYSAFYVIISVFTCLLIALLLGDKFAPSSVIMYFTAAIVLAIVSIDHHYRSKNISQLLQVPSSSLLCWVLLSIYFFYGTGHQPTFTAIHWQAAFVGTGGTFTHNFIPATLIGINTFGSFILMGITLPLLLIAPFTLSVMFPKVVMSKHRQDEKELRRGELLLFEHSNSTMNNLLVLCCKYILYHGLRMFACMLAATIHCRHLMVWKIFAPKLIFEGLSVMVTLPCVLLGYLFFVGLNARIEKLVVNLEKQNR